MGLMMCVVCDEKILVLDIECVNLILQREYFYIAVRFKNIKI